MRHFLAELEPLDPVTGNRVTLRVASAEDRDITGMGGEIWWPAIETLPSRSITLFDGDFSGSVTPGGGDLALVVNRLVKLYPHARRLFWPSAKVRIRRGAPGEAWPWADWFVGVVDSFQVQGNTQTLTLRVEDTPFQANVLTASYAGTGGREGGEDLKGQVKPLIFGRARNVAPILIDEVNSVFQFSGYGPVQGINALFERASSFGLPVGNAATYDALVALEIPPGRWATCTAEGMVRLGAPPAGLITGDVDGHKVGGGWPRLSGAIITAAAGIAGVDADLIDTTSLAAMDAAAPYTINIVLAEQITLIELAQRLARPCNHQAGVDWLGKLFVVKPSLAGPTITLDAQGRQNPKVIDNAESDVSPPYKRIAMGCERNWRVHSLDEIASPYTLILTGPYNATRRYRQGNIVDHNGKRWEYIYDTPLAGHEPMEGIYWTELPDSLSGLSLLYPDGTPVADLQPDEPNADNTQNQFPSVFTDKLGRSPEAVVGDLDISLESVAAAIMRGGLFKDELDRETTLPDGTKVKTWAQTIGLSIGETIAYVTDLREVSSDGLVRATMTLYSDLPGLPPVIGGMTALNTGENLSIYFAADEFGLVDIHSGDGGTPTKPFYYIDGILYMDNVRARKIAADTVETGNMVAGSMGKTVSVKSGTTYNGSGSPPGSTWQTVINYTLNLEYRANVTFLMFGRNEYIEAAGDFEAMLLVDGANIDVRAFAGAGDYQGNWGDTETMPNMAKGTHNLQVRWRASYGVHLTKCRVVAIINYVGGTD